MSEKKEEKRVYPTKARDPLRTMPQSLLIQAFPKVGKSCIAAAITTQFAPGKSVVITLGDEGSYDNHKVNEINVTIGKFEKLLDDLIKDQPYDFVVFDHLSEFDSWAEILGTIRYCNSTMGKGFNLKAEGLPKLGFNKAPQNYWKPKEAAFESCHTLANGYGYRWSKDEGIRLFNKMKKVAKHVIFIAHLKLDRYTKDDKGVAVNSTYLDVTGNLGKYICKNTDCLATMARKKGEGFLVFKTGHSDLDAGSRYNYLENKTFKISEKQEDGTVKTFWNEIYPNYISKSK